MSARRVIRGFSLVELMVAMVLGLLLTAAAAVSYTHLTLPTNREV